MFTMYVHIANSIGGWGIDPWRVRLLVKEFDFERGVVIVDGITKELEFYVDEKEYK